MSAKDIRNIIITLVILALGVRLLLYISGRFVSIDAAGELGSSFNDMGTLFMYGAIILALLMIPFYLSTRSDEKKERV